MSTFMMRKEDVEPKWYVVDATDQVVGRLAVEISKILRGKHRPEYTPHQDTGDFVIVTNVSKIRFTGNKWDQQTYDFYSHHPGGLKTITARSMLERHPERILELAVKRMFPRSRLGRQQLRKLKIYPGPQHPHQAQQPEELKLDI